MNRPASVVLALATVLTFLTARPAVSQPASCVPDDQTLCLLDGRLAVEVIWINQHDGGTTGVANAVPLTADTGAFWIFQPSNLEIFVKVLAGGAINGKIWVGVASLSDLELTVRVSDRALDRSKEYYNPPGNLWGVFDTAAFDDDLVGLGGACGGLVAPGTPFQCRPGLFCESPDGTCAQQFDGRGICTRVPSSCQKSGDLEREPVCGCDGVTYGNDCLRQMARVSLRHPGECGTVGTVCQPEIGLGCLEGQFCDRPVGSCSAEGICADVGDPICPEIFDPVCGCNGQTFSNDCVRVAAGVSKAHDGGCDSEPVLCGGIAGLRCDEGSVCEYPAGMCQVADLAGLCVVRPEACSEIYDPVCGCDGLTYANDCELLLAGAFKDRDGECQPQGQLCGGIAGLPCDEGFVCEYPTGMCQVADLAGTCTERPEACPAIYEPVCGCDGQTYGNDCHRLLVGGAAKAHDGECE